MKKYIGLSLVLLLLLVGCGRGQDQGTAKKEEVFSKFVKAEDLTSYELKVHNEVVYEGDTEANFEEDYYVEMTKDPNIYHSLMQSQEGQAEFYVVDDRTKYFREGQGGWEVQDLSETRDVYEDKTFVASNEINPTLLLESLGDYFDLSETEDLYLADLETTGENVEEINEILFGNTETPFPGGDLKSLKVQLSFEKGTYYPSSFEWEADFSKGEVGDQIKIKQRGDYNKVNQLEEIEIPDALKSL